MSEHAEEDRALVIDQLQRLLAIRDEEVRRLTEQVGWALAGERRAIKEAAAANAEKDRTWAESHVQKRIKVYRDRCWTAEHLLAKIAKQPSVPRSVRAKAKAVLDAAHPPLTPRVQDQSKEQE